MQVNAKTKKVLNILVKVVAWVIVAFTVFIMIFTITSVTTLDKNDRSIFGLKFYIVQTNSMSKSENNADMKVHFNAGDIIIAKNVKDPFSLQAGDIIAFMSSNSHNFGETVTHMIREVKTNDEGNVIGYVTFGTNTGDNDEALVEPGYVLGQYVGKLPHMGTFFAFVKTTQGYIICILVPLLILIIYNGVNCIRLFMKYKKEQTAKLEEDRAKLEAERQQNAEMLRELQALKEQLAKQASEKSDSAESSDSEQDTNE